MFTLGPLVRTTLASSRCGSSTGRVAVQAGATTPLLRPTPPLAAPYASPISSSSRNAAPPILETQQQKPQLAPQWFDLSPPRFDPSGDNGRPDRDNERKLKLGKTLRILQERLPTLLQSPLPQSVLSPNISLHLFPSTHPYLPTVSGRVAYVAALWTSPLAWNRVPIIGNVRLEILSERMVHQPLHFSPRPGGAFGEQLVVKWRTAADVDAHGNEEGLSLTEQGEQKLDEKLRGSLSSRAAAKKKPFTGLFIFEFDKEGRIISHTIEHVDEHHEWEKGVGARFVNLTDWLLGGIKGARGGDGGAPLPLFESAADKKGGVPPSRSS